MHKEGLEPVAHIVCSYTVWPTGVCSSLWAGMQMTRGKFQICYLWLGFRYH